MISYFRYVYSTFQILFFQGPPSVWSQAVASLFWPNIWYIYKTLEVSTATPADPRLQVRAQAMADWRDCLQDWSALLPLLVSFFHVVTICTFFLDILMILWTFLPDTLRLFSIVHLDFAVAVDNRMVDLKIHLLLQQYDPLSFVTVTSSGTWGQLLTNLQWGIVG